MDLSTWIERWAAFAPDWPAIICDGESLRYRALDAMIGRIAGGLRAVVAQWWIIDRLSRIANV